MFYLLSPTACVLMGLFVTGYAAITCARSVARGLFASSSCGHYTPRMESVLLTNRISSSGKCHVENYGYYPPLKKYVAEVVCAELDSRFMVVSDSKEGLEEKIAKEFSYAEERIRDRINKREMSKPLYFRIG